MYTKVKHTDIILYLIRLEINKKNHWWSYNLTSYK